MRLVLRELSVSDVYYLIINWLSYILHGGRWTAVVSRNRLRADYIRCWRGVRINTQLLLIWVGNFWKIHEHHLTIQSNGKGRANHLNTTTIGMNTQYLVIKVYFGTTLTMWFPIFFRKNISVSYTNLSLCNYKNGVIILNISCHVRAVTCRLGSRACIHTAGL